MHTCYLDSNLFYVGWLFLSGTGNFYTILRPNKHRQHPEETSNHITYTSNKLLNRITKKKNTTTSDSTTLAGSSWCNPPVFLSVTSCLTHLMWRVLTERRTNMSHPLRAAGDEFPLRQKKKNREKRRIKILRSNVCYCSGATLCFL